MSQLFCQLPDYIDRILFKEMVAIYKRGGNVDLNLTNNELQNRIYLGTYFPRSFSESYQLFNGLLRNPIIMNAVALKDSINVLDIGTGTGGNVLGMMQAMVENGLGSKTINIYTIEGNDIAARYCKAIIERFNSINNSHFVLQQERIIFLPERLTSQMTEFLVGNGIKYDFITTSKFVGEFYNGNLPKGLKLFSNFTTSVSPYLEPNGIYLLLDVVAGSYDHSKYFKTVFMSNEMNAYVKSYNSLLKYVYPYPCACWSSICRTSGCYIEKCFSVSHSRCRLDESKVAYRIMANKAFATEIVAQHIKRERYSIGKQKYCSKGIVSC